MAEVIYPSEKTLYGPWLLNLQRLQELDTIVDNQFQKMSVYRDSIIQSELGEKKKEYEETSFNYQDEELLARVKDSYRIQKYTKQLRVGFKSGKTVIANSFREIAMDKNLENDMPKDFTYKIECVDIEAKITNDTWSDNKISFSVNTLAIEEAKETYYEFENWLKQVSPPLYVKIWRKIGKWIPFLFIFLILLIQDKNISTKDRLVSEAHEILKDGINESELEKSIEILLALETKYEKDDSQSDPKPWDFQRIFRAFLILSGILIIMYPPNSIVGICKGEKKLNRWNTWIKIVTYIIPVMIILPILINLLTDKM